MVMAFAGPFQGAMFLIEVDAYSKWPEAIVMKSTTVEHTMDALRTVFARCGLPEQLVSDNGPQFTSEAFAIFVKANALNIHVPEVHHTIHLQMDLLKDLYSP